jgi:anti-sigma regulatory factor (Ser/Thr protein kinase)
MEMTGRIIAAAQTRLRVADPSHIGECRREAKRLAEGFEFDEAGMGRIAIIATELAANLVRHGGGGEMLLQVLDDVGRPEMELLAIDRGCGMADVHECMRDGYSTAGTAGTGLGAVSRLSNNFDVFSIVGQGTVVMARVAQQPETARCARSFLEFGAICVPVSGEVECGDTWRIADGGATVSMLVVDGLGHGPLAARASLAAADVFGERPFDEPSLAMRNMHSALAGGRGAAAACALLHAGDSKVDYAGVGNICGTVVADERSRGMVSHNGTLGVQLMRTQQFRYDWPIDSRVIMHSDGLSARWSLADYPGLQGRHCGVIAAVLYRDFARRRDDATVLVACHRR